MATLGCGRIGPPVVNHALLSMQRHCRVVDIAFFIYNIAGHVQEYTWASNVMYRVMVR